MADDDLSLPPEEDPYALLDLFDDITAKKSHEDMCAALDADAQDADLDLFAVFDEWFSANHEG